MSWEKLRRRRDQMPWPRDHARKTCEFERLAAGRLWMRGQSSRQQAWHGRPLQAIMHLSFSGLSLSAMSGRGSQMTSCG